MDERGNRQFRTAYVEIGKKNGKSELAAAVALNEVGSKGELKSIMGSEIDGAALADLIDKAAAYCAEQTKGGDAAVLMQKVSGRLIVQNISVDMLEFLTDCCE